MFKPMDPLKSGLSAEALSKVRECISHIPGIQKAILYGSRAKGNFRNGSDIDLCLLGDSLNAETILKLDNELDKLMLPYSFDLSIYDQIEATSLREHIDRVGLVFFEK